MVTSKLRFKQFSAHVKVDGKALECYSTWVDKRAKHVSCWIASEAGKAFSVLFEKDETKRSCAAYLSMGGAEITDEIYLRDDEQSEWDFIETSKGMGRRFKFSNLNVTEGEATVDETIAGSKIMEKIGLMEVTVYMAKRDGYFSTDSSSDDDDGEDSDKTPATCSVPKSVTQGKVLHQIGFGEEVIKAEDPTPVTPPAPPPSRPRRRPRKVPRYSIDKKKLLAKFTFRCRPLDVLQRAGITPRDPTSPPPDCEPVNGPFASLVNQRTDERTDETTDETDSGPQPDEPANGAVDEAFEIGRDINEFINGEIFYQVEEPVAEHKKLFDVKEEKKIIIKESDNSDDEDKEQEKFLLAELEKVRNKRFMKKEDTLEGSPRKRFKQEHRPAFMQGEVIDLT